MGSGQREARARHAAQDRPDLAGHKWNVRPEERCCRSLEATNRGAAGWGGNEEKGALYLDVTLARNDAKTIYRLNIKVVPVDGGFWSISVRPGYLCHPGWP